MRLQQKVNFFDKIGESKQRLLDSVLVVNDKTTEIKLSDLFIGHVREKNNTLRGYSILEFLDKDGNIQVNDKVVNLKFQDELGNKFNLVKVANPTDYILSDKIVPAEKQKQIELLLTTVDETSAESTQPQVQPQEAIPEEAEAPVLFENPEYEEEKASLQEEGWKELNTEPKSNFKLFVKEGEDPVLVEITEDDYKATKKGDFEIKEDHFLFKVVELEANGK